MSLRRDLLLVAVLALVGIAMAAESSGLIATVLGTLLALVLPGYAIGRAIGGRGATPMSEQFLFALGLSFLTTVLGGIALNLMPAGVRPFGWLALLSGVTAAGLIVATLDTAGAARPQTARMTVEPRPALLFALTALIVLGAGVEARAGADADPSASVTQLWMFPTQTATGQLEVGVKSVDGGRYRLEIWRGAKKMREWPLISLSPGKPWRQTVPIPTGTGLIEARLYRPDRAAVPLRLVTVAPPAG